MISADERIKNLIAKLVLNYNYWGYLFSRIRRKPIYDLPSIMGVSPEPDGTIILYYHPELVNNTDDKNLGYVLEHEGTHLLNKHCARLLRIVSNDFNLSKAKEKIKIWNIAADCCVNQQANLPKTLLIGGKNWNLEFPKKYNLPNGKVSEVYFLELLKRQKESEKNNHPMDISSTSTGDGGMDNHSDWTNNNNDMIDLGSLSRKVDSYIQNIVRDSLKTFNRERGDVPNYIKELIQWALLPAQIPYYQIIKKLIHGSKMSKFKRSSTRINRKRTYVFAFGEKENLPAISPFPGRIRDFSFKIVVLIDTSGSQKANDIKEALSGIKHIIDNDKHTQATVIEIDTKIHKEYKVKRVGDIDPNIKGRGGTRLGPALLRAKQLNCDVCLGFTDGYTENINKIPRQYLPKKIIWVIGSISGTSKNINKTGFVVKVPNL